MEKNEMMRGWRESRFGINSYQRTGFYDVYGKTGAM